MLSYRFGHKDFGILDEFRARLTESGIKAEMSRMTAMEGLACEPRRHPLGTVEFGLAFQEEVLRPKEIKGFAIWLGVGCEPMWVGLARPGVSKPRELADCDLVFEGYCETFGDKSPSIEVFEHRHVTACGILDLAIEMGIRTYVQDRSWYWNSGSSAKTRDLNKLRAAGEETKSLISDVRRCSPLARLAGAMYGFQNDMRPK